MLDRDLEVKNLTKRVKILSNYLVSLKKRLNEADKNDLHIGVLVTGKVLNSFIARFEFDATIERRRDNDLNTMLIRVVSNDFVELNRIRDVEVELIDLMLTSITQRLKQAQSNSN